MPTCDQEEEEHILGSVLAELGVEAANKMGDAPNTSMAAGAAEVQAQPVAAAGGGGGDGGGGGGDDLDADLQKRLDNLRRT